VRRRSPKPLIPDNSADTIAVTPETGKNDTVHTLQDLTDLAVVAIDGEAGKVRDWFFDDQSWDVRYLVVEMGSWLSRRVVLIPATLIDGLDWARKEIRVSLTKEQVRRYVDTTKSIKPVSWQQEAAMREYYGWSPSLGENTSEGAFPSFPTGQEYPLRSKGDPHLRSAEDVSGYAVWDKEGEIGRLENFIVNEGSWHIGYLDVRSGDWLHSRATLISTDSVKSISWAKYRVNLKRR
jgi:uncharacterized protein YrrD